MSAVGHLKTCQHKTFGKTSNFHVLIYTRMNKESCINASPISIWSREGCKLPTICQLLYGWCTFRWLLSQMGKCHHPIISIWQGTKIRVQDWRLRDTALVIIEESSTCIALPIHGWIKSNSHSRLLWVTVHNKISIHECFLMNQIYPY